MVLADLGRKINSAFTELTKAPVIDEKVYIPFTKKKKKAMKSSFLLLHLRFSIH